MEILERLEFDADLAKLLGCWSSHTEEEELVDNLSYLIIEEINLEPAERKLHSVLLFAALRGLSEDVTEDEEAYFESCNILLQMGCPWNLYLGMVQTCRWGRFLLEALTILPHQRAVEALKQILAADSRYLDHIVLEACITRLCTATRKEQLEVYQQLLRQVPANLEIFLHGLNSISSSLAASLQSPFPQGCVDLWLALKCPPHSSPSQQAPVTQLRLADFIQHRMPLFSGCFLQRFSSWLDTHNLDLDLCPLDLSHFHGPSAEDVEQTKTLALHTACSMAVLVALCNNFGFALDQAYLQAHAYLDIFQQDLPRLVEACLDKVPGWTELLNCLLMQEDLLSNNRLVRLMLENRSYLDWSHFHQVFHWILQQRHVDQLKELFLQLCQNFPLDYQNEVLYQVLHQLGLNTGLCLPNFLHQLTLCLNKQSLEGEDGVVALFLQSPLQMLDAVLAQVLDRAGQLPQLVKIVELVPSLCKFNAGGESGLLLARLKALPQTTDLTEQQEFNLLSFSSSLLQSQVLAISELDLVRTLVLPSLHLKANFRLAALLLKAVTTDQANPAWLQNIEETELSLPALLLCTCSIAAYCRGVGDVVRAKDLLDIVALLATYLAWHLRGNGKEKVKAWIRMKTRELSPTIWPYMDTVCPLTTEECSRLDVGLLIPKCEHLATLLRQVPPSQAYLQLVAVLSRLLPQCYLKEWEVMGRHFALLLEAGIVSPSNKSEEDHLDFFHAIADALVLSAHGSKEIAWAPTLATLGDWLQTKNLVSAKMAAPLTQRLLQLALSTGHQGVTVLLLELAASSAAAMETLDLLPQLQL